MPLKQGEVRIYTCGPTVYDYAHIGNFRAYIFADLLRRYLKYKGYKVFQVMNITDVDDKTIKGAREKKVDLKVFTQRYIQAFFEDIKTLNIEKVEVYPRATEHIKEMVELIKVLLEKGFAYKKGDSIYFRICKFNRYGKLSRMPITTTRREIREEDRDEYAKENPCDFVLWKAKKEAEPFWKTEIGEGRPGWHIECSAMAMKYLGESFDIHTGGEDNIFPHHENEIAQSECATGKRFVRYWLHCKFLLVNNEKMAKSKGNFYTLRDLLNKGYNPLAIRFLLLSVHYRHTLNFTENALRQAEETLKRLNDFCFNIGDYKARLCPSFRKDSFLQRIKRAKEEFEQAMDDDLNISSALSALFTLIREVNTLMSKGEIGREEVEEVEGWLRKVNQILGVLRFEQAEIGKEERELIKQREEARKRRDFVLADRIREELKKRGIIVEDTREGERWKKNS